MATRKKKTAKKKKEVVLVYKSAYPYTNEQLTQFRKQANERLTEVTIAQIFRVNLDEDLFVIPL